jgi:hypothetical protein
MPPITLPERADVRVLVVNSTDRAGLASRTGDELKLIGYQDVAVADLAREFGFTVIYSDDAHVGVAMRLAQDLDEGEDRVLPYPDEPITLDDSRGDIIVVLGTDRP